LASLSRLVGAMFSSVLLTFIVFSVFLGILAAVFNISPVLAVLATLLFMIIQYVIGPTMVEYSTGLRYLRAGENPWLEGTVRDLASRAGIPMPRLAIVQDESPNAFTFGTTRANSTLAVHVGLLKTLSEDEIRGVIGHELGHIKHRDFIVVTMLAALPLICYVAARGLMQWGRFGSRDRRESEPVALLAVGLAAYVIYFITLYLVRHLSRMREQYADAYSAYLTGAPHSLSSALAKIAYGLSLRPEETHGARAFYIEDPAQSANEVQAILERKDRYDLDRDGVLDERELELAMEQEAKSTWSRMNSAFSTHPPTYQRILLLREIEGEMRQGSYSSRTIYSHI